jgi:hypothetical protein
MEIKEITTKSLEDLELHLNWTNLLWAIANGLDDETVNVLLQLVQTKKEGDHDHTTIGKGAAGSDNK